MSPNVAITYYALPGEYLERLEAVVGHPVSNLVVSSMRVDGAMDVIRHLYQSRFDTIYLPMLSGEWGPFLPILHLLTRVPKARRVLAVNPDMSLSPLRLAGAVMAGMQLVVRTILALLRVPVRVAQLRRLAAEPRLDCTLKSERTQVLYLKTNLWSGVVAGGSVAHTLGVVGGLTANGFDVTYASPSDASELAGMMGVSIHRVPLPYGYTYPRELNALRYDRAMFRWGTRLDGHRFAFIYHRMSLEAVAAVELSRHLRVPLVLEYNGSEVWISDHWGSPLRYRQAAELSETICLRHAHLVVTVSEPLRDELIARGIEAERVVVHPNGFDPHRFDPAKFSAAERTAVRQRLGIPENAVVASFVGTFGPWHGANVLAQAVRRLAEECVLDEIGLHVLFIGDGVNRADVQAILAAPTIAAHTTFTGLVPQNETVPLLAASDIFVAPHVPNTDGTEFFGSPTKLFEYMGMGRPTLASALGQIADVLDGALGIKTLPAEDGPAAAGQMGVLVPPGHPDALARALLFAATHPVWRATAGANARARALEKHTWSQHVAAVLDGLRRVCPPRPAAPAKPTTVLINAVHAKSGGGVTYLRNILPHLAARPELHIEVVVQSDQAELFRPLIGDIVLHVLPSVSRLKTVFWQEQLYIPRLARRIGADVVFSPANYGPMLGGRFVIMLRNAFEVGRMEQRLGKRLYWLAVKLTSELSFLTCRRAIVVSNHAAANFLSAFRLDADPRMEVIHHGVSPLFHPPANNLSRVPHRLLAVSDIYVQKNFETLIEAMALLLKDFPDARLLIAGRPLDSDYYDELIELAGNLGLEDNIEFLGGLSAGEVAEHYRHAQVFVFPSLVETFGNPLLEAMASGTPVVCSRAAALPEVAGDAALYAKPGDPADMAAQIATLFNEPLAWHTQSLRGIERAGGFTWERCAERTARVFAEVAEP